MNENFVEWKIRYSVGIRTIDNQHKGLLKMTNNLYNACILGKDDADKYFKTAIHDAVEYVKIHFKTEEDLMIKYDYPDYKQHKIQHEKFIMEILQKVQDYHGGKKFVPNNFVRFLRDWLLEHIAITDKKYESFFKNKIV